MIITNITTHKTNNQYLVYDQDTGEILNDEFYPTSKAALTDYMLNHSQYQRHQTDQRQASVNWWNDHPTIWHWLDEIKYEEKIIQEPIISYQLFRKTILESGDYQTNIPIRWLWESFPQQGQKQLTTD